MSLVKKFMSVGSATMASRILGFLREVMIAAFLGTGPVADVFYAAFRFPNLFRRLFAEGAFNAAFVPLFAKRLEDNEDSARAFAKEVLSVLLTILLIISALAMIFMPFLVSTIIAPKFADNAEKFDLTILLTRIMFPYLAAMSLVAMLAAILNSLRKFFLAALAPVLLNIVLISGLIIAGIGGFDDRTIGITMAISVTISGALQLALLIYGVAREGFLPSLHPPKLTASVKRLLWLALPAAITGGIVQINLLVGQVIASAQDGAISIINYADRLLQLPLGIIGIAIGVVLLPELARAFKAGEAKAAMDLQNRSLEFGLLITLPAAVGLFVLPGPIIALLFERGAFDQTATTITSQVLAAFALGLPAFVMIKIFTPAYYVRENMRWPMWCSLGAVITNIGGSLVLFPTYGVVGIGIATAFSGWINLFMLMIPLMMRGLFVVPLANLKRLIAMLFAALIMGVMLYFAYSQLGAWYFNGRFLVQFISTIGTVVMGSLVYFVCSYLLGGFDRKALKAAIKRR